MDPVRVKFAGEVISATPFRKLPNGDWWMQSCVKHKRFDMGHLIEIRAADIMDPILEVIDALDA